MATCNKNQTTPATSSGIITSEKSYFVLTFYCFVIDVLRYFRNSEILRYISALLTLSFICRRVRVGKTEKRFRCKFVKSQSESGYQLGQNVKSMKTIEISDSSDLMLQ